MELARMAFDQAWQLAALIIFVWLTARTVARNRPHLAYVLWLVVLLKAVAPPVWSSPTGFFSWVQASSSLDAILLRIPADTFYQAPSIIAGGPPAAPFKRTHVSAFESLNELPAARFAVSSPNAGLSRFVFGVLVVIWCIGALGTLFITMVRWFRCIHLLRVSPTVNRPDLTEMVTKLSRQLRIGKRVRLLVTASRIGPAVIGLFRPLIVLPAIVVQGKRADELEAMIAHELLHIRRGDLWLGLLQVCAKAVWWFHPLVWWAGRMSTQEAERCCDEEVIGELRCDPKRYARSLLEVLELKRTLRTIPAFPGMKPVEVTSQRLERIMQLGQGCHNRTPRWCWAVLLLLAAGALPGAALVFATDEAAPLVSEAAAPLQVVAADVDVDNTESVEIEIGVEFLRAPQATVDAAVSGWILQPANGLPPSDAESESPAKLKSVRVTEARLPLVYKVIDDRESVAITQAISKDHRVRKVTAPRVVVFDLQSVSIMDTSQRPFVVGLLPDGKPQIRVISEGITLHVRPALVDETRLQLEYDVRVSKIAEVQTGTFSFDGSDEPLTLQVPVVETNQVASNVSFRLGQTLLIGGIQTKDDAGEQHATLVMMKATRRPSATGSAEPTRGTGVDSDAGVAGETETADMAPVALAPIEVASRPSPKRSRPRDTNVHPRVYNVADLVVPIPSVFREPKDLPRYGKIPKGSLADFDTLIDRITSTIAPESWDKVGGVGAIEAFPTNLSLVISQTVDVHEQVAELLETLRESHNVQITLETHWLKVPASSLSREETPGFVVRNIAELDARAIEDVGGPVQISAARATALLQDAGRLVINGPKITLFNGQQAQVTEKESGLVKTTWQYQATGSVNNEFVFLKVATDADIDLKKLNSEMIRSGDSLLLRINESAVAEWPRPEEEPESESILWNLLRRATTFNCPPPATPRIHLLLVTPKVIVIDE